MSEPLELEWLGGPAERRFRRRRPAIEELPWDELRPGDLAPAAAERARIAWTRNVIGEYAGAACFAATAQALLAAGAPVDLTAMAADFVVDELTHVELCARIAMRLGGAAPADVDLGALAPRTDPALTARQRASELVVRVACVSESFNVAALRARRSPTRDPFLRAAHDFLLRDEAHHARFGWLYLDWAADSFDTPERARLAAAAGDQMRALLTCDEPDLLDEHVIAPLRRRGIEVERTHP